MSFDSVASYYSWNITVSRSLFPNHSLHHFFELLIGDLAISIDIDFLDHVTPNLVVDLLALVKNSFNLSQVDEPRVILYKKENVSPLSIILFYFLILTLSK